MGPKLIEEVFLTKQDTTTFTPKAATTRTKKNIWEYSSYLKFNDCPSFYKISKDRTPPFNLDLCKYYNN